MNKNSKLQVAYHMNNSTWKRRRGNAVDHCYSPSFAIMSFSALFSFVPFVGVEHYYSSVHV